MNVIKNLVITAGIGLLGFTPVNWSTLMPVKAMDAMPCAGGCFSSKTLRIIVTNATSSSQTVGYYSVGSYKLETIAPWSWITLNLSYPSGEQNYFNTLHLQHGSKPVYMKDYMSFNNHPYVQGNVHGHFFLSEQNRGMGLISGPFSSPSAIIQEEKANISRKEAERKEKERLIYEDAYRARMEAEQKERERLYKENERRVEAERALRDAEDQKLRDKARATRDLTNGINSLIQNLFGR